MNRILRALTSVVALCAVAGCATKPEPSLGNDWHAGAGTDHTPYRTIPAAIQCDDCRYAPER